MNKYFTLLVAAIAIFSAVNGQDSIELDAVSNEGEISENLTDQELIHAASVGDLGLIEDYIKEGRNLDERNEHGWTPVIFAVENGHNEAFRMLVEGGADLNIQENDGWTALMFAAFHGDENMVSGILEANGDPMELNNDGYAAHTIAQNQGHHEIAQRIAEEALVRAMSIDDLHSAISLIREGAGVNTQNNNGWTALHLAVSLNEIDYVNILLDELNANTNIHENDGWTPLMFAANNNFLDVAKALIAKSATIDHKSESGMSAKSLAEAENFTEMVALLSAGSTTEHKTHDKVTKPAETVPVPTEKIATAGVAAEVTPKATETAATAAKVEPEAAAAPKKKGFWG